MAERKSIEKGPIMDSSQADNTVRKIVALPESGINSFIRFVMSAPRESVMVVRNATYNKLRELGIPRDLNKAVNATPAGTSQTSTSAIIEWLGTVGPKNKPAIRQVVILDATSVARSR